MRKLLSILVMVLLTFSCKKVEPKKVEPIVPKVKKDTVVPIAKEKVEAPTLIYVVQIGAFKKGSSKLSKVSNVQITKESNLFKYRLGTFRTYQEARRYRLQSLDKYPDAFVQALKNGKPIGIQQALKSK